ncbi:MAG: hypothetical protein HOV83_39315 [Catenulispora sp.]|nr:hypothetical protein [Catenulispora sp.]
MACEEEFNALKQAREELARYRHRHPDVGPGPVPTPSDSEVLPRLAELTAAVQQKQAAYDLCRGQTGEDGIEALMRDDTGRPLGGDAGPPM